MIRQDGLKPVSYRVDPTIIEKFDNYMAQFTGISKQEVIAYLMDHCADTVPEQFIIAFKAYLTKKIDRDINYKTEGRAALDAVARRVYDSLETKEIEDTHARPTRRRAT